jgi:hypothetical protein
MCSSVAQEKPLLNGVRCQDFKLGLFVIPAQAGIQIAPLDSRLRGNDGWHEPLN